MSSLGDSGLSVFHAGHWDWQRPHSVQVVKSRMPFQEKSSIAPTPSVASSSRSSMSSRVTGLPLLVSGFMPPRAVVAPSVSRPTDSRLKKMLNQAVKRCQATPMVRLEEMTISQVMARTTLIIAMITMMFSRTASLPSTPAGKRSSPTGPEIGKWKRVKSSGWSLSIWPRLYSAPRMKRIAELSSSTNASTK